MLVGQVNIYWSKLNYGSNQSCRKKVLTVEKLKDWPFMPLQKGFVTSACITD